MMFKALLVSFALANESTKLCGTKCDNDKCMAKKAATTVDTETVDKKPETFTCDATKAECGENTFKDACKNKDKAEDCTAADCCEAAATGDGDSKDDEYVCTNQIVKCEDTENKDFKADCDGITDTTKCTQELCCKASDRRLTGNSDSAEDETEPASEEPAKEKCQSVKDKCKMEGDACPEMDGCKKNGDKCEFDAKVACECSYAYGAGAGLVLAFMAALI